MMSTLSYQFVILNEYAIDQNSKLLVLIRQFMSNYFKWTSRGFVCFKRMINPIQPFLGLYAVEVGGGGESVFAPSDFFKSYSFRLLIKEMCCVKHHNLSQLHYYMTAENYFNNHSIAENIILPLQIRD